MFLSTSNLKDSYFNSFCFFVAGTKWEQSTRISRWRYRKACPPRSMLASWRFADREASWLATSVIWRWTWEWWIARRSWSRSGSDPRRKLLLWEPSAVISRIWSKVCKELHKSFEYFYQNTFRCFRCHQGIPIQNACSTCPFPHQLRHLG